MHKRRRPRLRVVSRDGRLADPPATPPPKDAPRVTIENLEKLARALEPFQVDRPRLDQLPTPTKVTVDRFRAWLAARDLQPGEYAASVTFATLKRRIRSFR